MAEEARPLSTGPTGSAGRRPLAQLALAFFVLVFSFASQAAPLKKNPSWVDLTPEQQQTLQPLAGEWDSMDSARRTKWIGIAKRYPAMSEVEQKRVQTRMSDWVKLTPDQRRVAREQFRKIGKLPPGKREVVGQHWEEYQQLPADVKRNLAAETKKKTENLEPRSRAKTAQAKKSPVVAEPHAPSPAMSSVIPTSAN
jgi:hypothetical protein